MRAQCATVLRPKAGDCCVFCSYGSVECPPVQMNTGVSLLQAATPHEWDEARRLVREYAASLDVDLAFQNFDEELQRFSSEYAPPKGAFLLARDQGEYLACIGVREFSDEIGEIKRLYVVPVARGRGLGRVLVERIIAVARDIGYRSLLLDTLPFMKEAQALYSSFGFKPTSAYRFNPIEGSAFLRLDL
jgi:GNAT superfamily N-acetyltransferase